MCGKPTLSWIAVRYIDSMAERHEPSLEELFRKAVEFGLSFVELHHCMLPSYDRKMLNAVCGLLSQYGLGVSQLTCAPDFTHPDERFRENELEHMKTMVEVARVLGASGVRVTVGCAHEGVSLQQGVEWATRYILRLLDFAEPRGIKLGLENHYKDRLWKDVDFAFHPDVFLEVFHRLEDTPVGVNFDASNPLMVGEDPLRILREVKHKVWHMHASDRRVGEYQHTVVGEGDVNYDAIMSELSSIVYCGFISLEDGNPFGDDGTRRSLAFLRRKIEEHFGSS
ncbi:MAG: sugar phosphate isomerase/epimerase [Armatimonadota bacterium]|nr:sugar phosphate isomerase/epimerase [Armatimonadota bacterium]MCX7778225.1 sugar phosphate isomerase/epimerase [Armatimonadota bacterium]MDW8024491.1 sugar phosphate isomerase/epimerase [Armatimonadota bacterium]